MVVYTNQAKQEEYVLEDMHGAQTKEFPKCI